MSPRAALTAALCAAGPGAVASHRSAAHAWGLLAQPPPLPVVSVRLERRPRLTGAVVHRSADLATARVVPWHDVPVTSPLRTVVDVAADGDDAVLREVIDAGCARRLFDIEAVAAELARLARRGRPGIGQLRAHLARRGFTTAPPPSELEQRAHSLLEAHGVTVLGTEVVVCGGRYRVDVRVTATLVVELLGYAWHWSPEAMRADLARCNALQLQGLQVLQFSWADVVGRPAEVIATVRQAISRS